SVMQAAVLAAPMSMRTTEVAVPEPGFAQVRIRVEGCGICGSNLPPWEGRPWFDYPFPAGSPGHEAWGTVDAVGEGVDEVPLGARVAALSYRGFAEYDIADAATVV